MLVVVEKRMIKWNQVLWSELCLIIETDVEVIVRGCGYDCSTEVGIGWGDGLEMIRRKEQRTHIYILEVGT